MCVSFWAAKFSNTITGTWEVMVDGQLNHVLWYQNSIGVAHNPRTLEMWVKQVVDGNVTIDTAQPVNYASNQFQFFRSLEVHGISEWLFVNALNARLKSLGRHDELQKVPLRPEQANCLIIPLLGSWESIRLLNTTSAPSLLMDIREAIRETRAPITTAFCRHSGLRW